jgi:type VI secretion system protein ImpF
MRHSILERLIDRTRDRSPNGSGAGTAVAVAEEIRRDVENLLNTRCAFSGEWASERPEMAGTIVCYGMPEEGHVNLTSQKDVDDLGRRIRGVVERFEPRLSRVRVKVLERPKDLSRDVLLEITATVRVEDYQERVTWNSALHGGSIELKGE